MKVKYIDVGSMIMYIVDQFIQMIMKTVSTDAY